MGDNPPYRSPGGPKPEQLVTFTNSYKDGETCIDSANKWLKEMFGIVEIVMRDVAKNNEGHYREVLIWYREL